MGHAHHADVNPSAAALPLYFLNGPLGARLHEAYFSQHEGAWTHGDLIEFTAEGTAMLHGRCDGVLNVRGIRIGPAEISLRWQRRCDRERLDEPSGL